MPPLVVTGQSLSVLQSSALELPRQSTNPDVRATLEATFADFFTHLDRLDGRLAGLVDQRTARSKALAGAILDSWRDRWREDVYAARLTLDAGLEQVRPELISMSRRHAKVLPGQSWYRLAAWDGVSDRKHMFHTPFDLRQGSYRFSTPGAPSLYLANSVYLCWLECGEPPVERCFVSRFEIDLTGFELLDLAVSSQAYVTPLDLVPGISIDPRKVTNSPYQDDVDAEIAEYLTVWPLLAAMTLRRPPGAAERPPEYIIPQLLMLWARESEDFLGVRYFTSRDDGLPGSQDWSINLALPTRAHKSSGYCDFLLARSRWTEPQPLAKMERLSVNDLATLEAVERREQRSGRVMLTHGGEMYQYFATTFGKMEYWLDRPELELDTI